MVPTVEFNSTTDTGSEGATPVALAVSISAVSGKTVTVDYLASGGSAIGGGTDYSLDAGTLIFAPGETTKNIDLSVIDDVIDEANETIIMTLSSPTQSTLGSQSSSTYTIADNDAEPEVGFESGSSGGVESILGPNLTVSLSAVSGKTVSVNYSVSGGTAVGTGTDFTLVAGTLTFPAGVGTQDIPLTVIDDALDENDETIIVSVSSPNNAVLSSNIAHTYMITDDDLPPTVGFISDSTGGGERALTPSYTVDLSAASGKIVTVNYSAVDGTATGSGVDYSLIAGALTFNPGEISKNFSANIVDDHLIEGAETFDLNLAGAVNASLGISTHTYTIDDDPIGGGLAFMQGTLAGGSTNLNPVTATAIDWSAVFFDGAYFTHSGGNPNELVIAQNGDYYITATVPLTGAVARGSVRAELRLNGVPIVGAVGESAYIRNSSGHNEASNHIAAFLPGLTASDVIELYVSQAAAAGTITASNQITLSAEFATPGRLWFKGIATKTTNSTNLNQATAFALEWNESVEEAPFAHENGVSPENITVLNAGDYRVDVSIPIQSASVRTNLKVRVKVNGVDYPGAIGASGYIRNTNGHNNASIHWFGLLSGLNENDVLTVTTEQEAAVGTVVVQAGNSATIQIEQIVSGELLSLRGTNVISGTNWNVTDFIQWTTQEVTAGSTYAHSTGTDSHQVSLLQAGDYQLVYSDKLMSGGVRPNVKVSVFVNGNPWSGAETKSHYIRNGSGHSETSGVVVFLMRDLAIGDVLSVQTEREAGSGATTANADARLLLWKK